jgi:hypothetical protein
VGLALVLSCALCPARAQSLYDLPPDTPVARVGGRTITAGDVQRETLHRYAQMAVGQLIFERFLEERCKAQGIAVDESTLLPGQDRHRVMFERLVADQVTSTDDELRAFYDQRPELYRLQVVHAHGILLDSEEDAKDLLGQGVLTLEAFERWARDLSSHASAAQGGDLGEVSILTFPKSPKLAEALLAPGDARIIGPLQGEGGWWIFLRDEPHAGDVPLFEVVRDLVERDLRMAKLETLWDRRLKLVERGLVVVALGGLWDRAGGPPSPALPPELTPPPDDGKAGEQ